VKPTRTGLSDLTSRAAYLKGLIRGLAPDGSGRERVLAEVVDLLDDVVREVVDLRDRAPDGTSGRTGAGGDRASASGRARPGTCARSPEPERTTFLACECPRCGGDIFLEAQSISTSGPRGPEFGVLPPDSGRDYEVTCPHCGEILHAYSGPRAPAPHPPGAAHSSARRRPLRLLRPLRAPGRRGPGRCGPRH